MRYNKAYMKRGFTLIELMVVISIISVLSSITIATMNVARTKARNSVRVSDVYQIRKALELFYYKNDKYPLTINELVTDSERFLSALPKDPVGNTDYFYQAYEVTDTSLFNNGHKCTGVEICQGFHLSADLENPASGLLISDRDVVSSAIDGADTGSCELITSQKLPNRYCYDYTQ